MILSLSFLNRMRMVPLPALPIVFTVLSDCRVTFPDFVLNKMSFSSTTCTHDVIWIHFQLEACVPS